MSGADANPKMGLLAWLKGRLLGSSNIAVTPKNCSLGISITGQIPPVNGGLGISTTPTNGMVPIGNGSDYTAATLTQGTGITITNGGGSITIAATGGGGTGTVTSVAMTGDGTLFNSTVSGSPITVSGTLAPALLTQTKNLIFAGPSSGSALAPTFRAQVASDQPSTTVNTTGNLSPLFTSAISAQALSFTLSTATNPSWFGASGSTTPAYQTGALPIGLGGGYTTATGLTALVNVATSSLSGACPILSGTSTTYLNGSGTFTTPAGSGISGTGVSGEVTYWNGTSTVTGGTGLTYVQGSGAELTTGVAGSLQGIIGANPSSGTSGAAVIQGATGTGTTQGANLELGGATSGSCILTAGAVAGSVSLILPSSVPGTGGSMMLSTSAGALSLVNMSGDATLGGGGAFTLATVNTNVGSFTNASITVNAKGLITAASSGSGGVTGSGASGQLALWNGSGSITGLAGFTYNSHILTVGDSSGIFVELQGGSGNGVVNFENLTGAGFGLVLGPPSTATGGPFTVTIPAVTGTLLSSTAFKSANQTVAISTAYGAFTHGLGYTPTRLWATLTCVTANAGYAAGDMVTFYPGAGSATSGEGALAMFVTTASSNTTTFSVTSSLGLPNIPNKTTGTATTITAADWTYNFYAQ